MNSPPAPAHYQLRIQGHLDQHWSAWFSGLTLTRHNDGTTTLRGPVTDQAALHGLLAKIRDLGATLISLSTVDAPRTRDRGRTNDLHCTRDQHQKGPLL